jgi:hypothetical protein
VVRDRAGRDLAHVLIQEAVVRPFNAHGGDPGGVDRAEPHLQAGLPDSVRGDGVANARGCLADTGLASKATGKRAQDEGLRRSISRPSPAPSKAPGGGFHIVCCVVSRRFVCSSPARERP